MGKKQRHRQQSPCLWSSAHAQGSGRCLFVTNVGLCSFIDAQWSIFHLFFKFVFVVVVDSERVKELEGKGATSGSVAEIANSCPIIITMLPASAHVLSHSHSYSHAVHVQQLLSVISVFLENDEERSHTNEINSRSC